MALSMLRYVLNNNKPKDLRIPKELFDERYTAHWLYPNKEGYLFKCYKGTALLRECETVI